MKETLQAALIVLSVAALINLLLYLAQHLLGWSIMLRYGVGALLLLFGALSIQGDGPKATLTARRYARTTKQEDDLEEFRKARRKGVAAGWQFILVGAATLGFTLLFP